MTGSTTLPHLLDDIDLLGGTEEPGIHRVQFHANTCPGSQIIAQDIGGIVHVPAGEGGVAGEQARGHGAHVAAGGGQHRDGHTERALAVAAQVVDGGHAGAVGVFAFVEVRHGIPFEIGRPTGRHGAFTQSLSILSLLRARGSRFFR